MQVGGLINKVDIDQQAMHAFMVIQGILHKKFTWESEVVISLSCMYRCARALYVYDQSLSLFQFNLVPNTTIRRLYLTLPPSRMTNMLSFVLLLSAILIIRDLYGML